MYRVYCNVKVWEYDRRPELQFMYRMMKTLTRNFMLQGCEHKHFVFTTIKNHYFEDTPIEKGEGDSILK